MTVRLLVMMTTLTALPLLAAAGDVVAQTSPLGTSDSSPVVAPSHQGRTRIEIYPSPLLHRRCVDWYELQYRPSGTVLYPQMRCWWVRG